MGPACSGLQEIVGQRERMADESQAPDVEQMSQTALGCLPAELATPGAPVRPTGLFRAQRKPVNFLY